MIQEYSNTIKIWGETQSYCHHLFSFQGSLGASVDAINTSRCVKSRASRTGQANSSNQHLT